MDYELNKASRRLSELPLSLELPGCTLEVQWFRIMQKAGTWNIPRHAHSSFEFHIIARGSCTVTTDTGTFHIGEGSFYLTGPGIHHEQSSAGEGELVEYSLDCKFRNRKESSAECSALLQFLLETPCTPFADANGTIPLFEQAIREALQLRPGYGLLIQTLVPAILVSAARSMGYGYAKPQNPQDTRMDRIADFVEDNIYRSLAPSDIAAFMNLSEKQISRIVYASEGFSTKRFITLAKLNQAKKLLESDTHSLSEIAEELGFSNVSYFSNVFKRNEGITPGSYRTKSHGKGDIDHT